ncbi:Zn-dependent oligopeptidase [bacterium]|nr:Zn-dependent oligopeptidase [bacterium]
MISFRTRSCTMHMVLLLSGIVLISPVVKSTENPLFPEFNQPMMFGQLNADAVNQAKEGTIGNARAELAIIYDIPAEERTFDNTLRSLDALQDRLNSVWSTVYLMAYTHPDDAIREACNTANVEFEKFSTAMAMDEKLYQAVKAFSKTKEAGALTGYRKKFLDETLRDFRRNGFGLPAEKRKELKALKDKITEISNLFSKNIRDYQDSLIVNESDVEGLPEDYKKTYVQTDGTYKLDMSYPSYVPFMEYSESDAARKALYLKFTNRAKDSNLDVLDSLLIYRKRMVNVLGYKTYAEYGLETRMAKDPKTVWDFEYDLKDQLLPKAKLDYEELLEAKRSHTGDAEADTIYSWEKSFYNTLLLRTKYNLDPEEVKQYLELDNVLSGLFAITQTLFGVTYSEVGNPSVWNDEVRLFEVFRDGNLIGRFYMDMFPRKNKYSHAACFGLVKGRETGEGYQIPSATMVCNFPKPTEDKPSLLSHDETVTFFHEFGHLLHNILTRSPLGSYAGTNVERDFVEVPSQIMENWAWDYASLKMFARHYQTGEVLPEDLFNRMIAAKNVNSGNNTLQQVYYGVLDMTLHDQFDPEGTVLTTQVVKELQNDLTLFPFVEGSHFHAAFDHLTGYAAGYYGYLWALVYAQDMFSLFETAGIMDKETGKRLGGVFSKGGSVDPMVLVKDFLGREPNQKAFIRSLGLKEEAR